MKKNLILIFSLLFTFSCSSVSVETVEDQKTKTVDITESSSSSFAVGESLDLGEPSVRIYFVFATIPKFLKNPKSLNLQNP